MAEEGGDDGRPTVLVVDDEPAVADRYSGWLADRYDVRTAHEGEAAIEVLREDPDAIDAVLLSRRTSELSEDLVLVSIRDAGFDCPVALVTDRRPDFDVVDRGFDDYLTEPVSEGALLRSVGSLLAVEGREALRRELSAKRVRRNVLELELSGEELETNEAFARLERDIERLERRLSLHRERLEAREGGQSVAGT
ncbi:MAG: HalX domain-containing protein [Haloarculaceae archaeon]